MGQTTQPEMKDSKTSRPIAVFVWSLPEDPRFLDFLQREHGDYLLCCMDIYALRTARRFAPLDRIVDGTTLITPEERESVDMESSELFNRFWRELLRYREEPWLASLEFANDGNPFFHALYWKRVLERVSQLNHGGGIRFYGPFSRGAWPGTITFSVDVMEAFVDRWILSATTTGHGWFRRIIIRAALGAGFLVNRFASVCARGSTRSGEVVKPADVLICGLQETDRLVQAELVRRLYRRGLTGIRWLVLSRGNLPVSADEASDKPDDDLDSIRDPVGSFGCYRWRHSWLEALSRWHVRHRFEEAIKAASAGRLDDGMCEALAETLEKRNVSARMKYLEIDELLRPYHPSLIVGNSVVDEMICVRQWARRHRVPFVRFPHGVELAYRDEFEWDAECVCIFGEESRQGLLRAKTAVPEKIRVVGGMHLAAQSNRGSSWSADAWSRNPWRCSMLVSFAAFMNYPDTVPELQADLLGLADAVKRQGGLFGVRLHPRQSEWDGPIYHEIAKHAAEAGVQIDFSSSQDSLSSELTQSAFALVRMWSGAAVAALYTGVPLVGWVPRPGLPESWDIIARLPLHASSVDQFEEIVRRLKTDEAFRANALQAQRDFLAHLVSEPWSDPWERAVDVIIEQARSAGLQTHGNP